MNQVKKAFKEGTRIPERVMKTTAENDRTPNRWRKTHDHLNGNEDYNTFYFYRKRFLKLKDEVESISDRKFLMLLLTFANELVYVSTS